MKRLAFLLMLTIVLVSMTACAGKGPDKASSPDESAALTSGVNAAQAESASATTEMTVESDDANRPVDLDLSVISGTVVYSQVYDMMSEPEAYIGQKIKMKGNFGYYQDPDTKQEYFAAVIADATACCAQGIEFVWKGEHVYPRDYPPLDTEITVTGTFGTYFEGDAEYIQLTDADVVW